MAGTLYLGCGSVADEAALWRSMFHRPTTRIVYWPFALPAEMCAAADDWLRSSLGPLDVGYELNTWSGLAGHDPAELDHAWADLLFVGGGNTFRLLDQVRRHGFLEQVRRFWLSGGDYYGGSAGAVLACDSIDIAEGHDANEPRLEDLTALGLLSGAAVLPHFTEDQLHGASRWATARRTVVLGMPESVGLQCRGGKGTVTGSGRLTRLADHRIERIAAGANLDLAVQ